jgi:hypothetical protein
MDRPMQKEVAMKKVLVTIASALIAATMPSCGQRQ